jgi:hypothetical protein
MNENETVQNGLTSAEMIEDLAEPVRAGEIDVYRVNIRDGQVILTQVRELDHISLYYISAKNSAGYLFEHNTWGRANHTCGSNSGLTLVNSTFNPARIEHYQQEGVRTCVADGYFAAKLSSSIDETLNQMGLPILSSQGTVLHGQHDPSKDGLIEHFLKKAKRKR